MARRNPLDRPSRIIPHLYQGDYLSPTHFHTLPELHVACAQERPPSRNSARHVLHLKLADVSNVQWVDSTTWCMLVGTTASMVAQTVGQGRRALVTCNMGLNRSGLIVALALCHLGYSPEAAIQLVKRGRSQLALSNPRFIEAIYQLG